MDFPLTASGSFTTPVPALPHHRDARSSASGLFRFPTPVILADWTDPVAQCTVHHDNRTVGVVHHSCRTSSKIRTVHQNSPLGGVARSPAIGSPAASPAFHGRHCTARQRIWQIRSRVVDIAEASIVAVGVTRSICLTPLLRSWVEATGSCARRPFYLVLWPEIGGLQHGSAASPHCSSPSPCGSLRQRHRRSPDPHPWSCWYPSPC